MKLIVCCRWWDPGAVTGWIDGTVRRITYTIWTGGACLPSSAWTAAATDSILEFPRQWGGHTSILLSGQWQCRWIPAGRAPLQESCCEGSSADRQVLDHYSVLCDSKTQTTVNIKAVVLYYVHLCSLIWRCQHFGGTCLLSDQSRSFPTGWRRRQIST